MWENGAMAGTSGHASAKQMPAYHYSVQQPLRRFWQDFGIRDRRVLFIFGVGFDPRCVPALSAIAEIFGDEAELTTFCVRFTNLFDQNLATNARHTRECLEQVRYITRGLASTNQRHFEVEVNLFSVDGEQVGDALLIGEFADCLQSRVETFTDIVVDISAFPRSLMYVLLAHLWHRRRPRQNLFAVVTEVEKSVAIAESGYTQPCYMLGERRCAPSGRQVWIPVLGSEVERYKRIYEFLQPDDVFPIISFPDSDPRVGDDILLAARSELVESWNIPFGNVMYASGSVPLDVFRKICDFVESHSHVTSDVSVVVSALSGRSLSLGVLMAALRCGLYYCHSQPTTYYIRPSDRDQLKRACLRTNPTLIWLDGELYEDE
jgi:hypothetical protein